MKSISSRAFWPTSPIHMSPVWRSKVKRQGLRRPMWQIALLIPDVPTNGLSAGM